MAFESVMSLTWASLVELPGIGPATIKLLTCGNADSGYAKQRESTRNALPIRRRC
jgi:hypothetical protein